MNLKKIRILNFTFFVFLFLLFYPRNTNAYTAYEDKYIACKKDNIWQCVLVKNKGVLTCDGAPMDTYNECLTNVKAIVAAEPKWYMCHAAASQMIWTCKSSFVPGCLKSPIFSSSGDCQKKIVDDGGTYKDTEVYSADAVKAQAAAKAKAEQDAKAAQEQAQAEKTEADAKKAQQDSVKKAAADDAAAAASMVCDCSAKDPTKQCRDDFKSVSEANEYCGNCSATPQSGECPLGTKETGPFSCTCGTGEDKKCVTFDAFLDLKNKCLAPCAQANGACSIDTSDSLGNLKKAAKNLNPAGFAFGTAGVTEIIGKIISFLLFPIGMFTMALYIWAGFLWMTAQGNSENVTKSKQILVWTTLGVVITLASYLIVKLVFTEIL